MKKDKNLLFFKKVYSEIDKTVKFIFFLNQQIVEFSYINKNDGKDIICVPTQTACNLKCKFCFLSDYDLDVKNLSAEHIEYGVSYIIKDLGLCLGVKSHNRVLLISFMGCGEPLLNLGNVINSCELITEKYKKKYHIVRYGLSSLIPNLALMKKMVSMVLELKIPMKFHFSLHTPIKKKRKELLPSASDIRKSIELICKYIRVTGNSAEIHYALIDGVNDTDEDLFYLINLLKEKDIPVKFLIYNEKPSLDLLPSYRVVLFREKLELADIKTEFYIPPGGDIGSSCGQFLMDYYREFNIKK